VIPVGVKLVIEVLEGFSGVEESGYGGVGWREDGEAWIHNIRKLVPVSTLVLCQFFDVLNLHGLLHGYRSSAISKQHEG